MKTIILGFLGFFFIACQAGGSYADQEGSPEQVTMQTEEQQQVPPPRTQQKKTADDPQNQRKLIRKANLRMEIEDYQKSNPLIIQTILNLDGVIENSEEKLNDYVKEHQMKIRIEPENLDTLVNTLSTFATRIDRKQIETDDVTRNYIDIATRVNSKRAVIERYQELIQQAKNVEEVLKVEEYLRVVTEEVEAAEAQLLYMDNQIQKSTLKLSYAEYQDRPVVAKRGFGKRLVNSLKGGWEMLTELILGIIFLWPLVIGAIFIVYFIRKRSKTATNKKEV